MRAVSNLRPGESCLRGIGEGSARRETLTDEPLLPSLSLQIGIPPEHLHRHSLSLPLPLRTRPDPSKPRFPVLRSVWLPSRLQKLATSRLTSPSSPLLLHSVGNLWIKTLLGL